MTPISLSATSLFPGARSFSIPAEPTLLRGENLVQSFVNEVSLHVSEVPDARLTARTERIAAGAIYNMILEHANSCYGSNVPPATLNQEDYMWYTPEPTNYRALFKRDFALYL